MKSSYLIQRLKKPYPKTTGGILRDNPFAFGGGLKNGDLSDGAMDILREIFRFDYMGSSEFEWGAVPDALNKIANNIEHYTRHEFVAKTKSGNSATVYIVCRKSDLAEIKDRISTFAYNEYGKNTPHTKELVGLDRTIDGEKYADTVGWLELDNGFFFFTERGMFEKTSTLFGVH